MKPFKIRTMNSIYELDNVGLWQNGLLYCEAEEINDIYFTESLYGYGEVIREPTVETMLYVQYNTRFIRTSPIMEVLSAQN